MEYRILKMAAVAASALLLPVSGCRSLKIEKHGQEVVQTSSNTWVVVDGGWSARYHAFGMWTRFGELSVAVETNGLRTISLRDLNTDVSTNHVAIIAATGGTASDIARAIMDAVR